MMYQSRRPKRCLGDNLRSTRATLAPARRIVSGWGILRLILSMVSPICMSKNLFLKSVLRT